MLLVIGGCSRSGKSLLAERVRDRHGVPWFPLDALKMGLHLGAPSLEVRPDDNDLATADRMWPIIKGIFEHLLWDGRDYLVEGNNLRPRTVATFISETDGPIRTCFLGYPQVDIEAKARRVEQYTAIPTDWLARTGSHNVRRYLEEGRAQSRRLQEDCAALGIPFFDTGDDFLAGIASAEHALMRPADR